MLWGNISYLRAREETVLHEAMRHMVVEAIWLVRCPCQSVRPWEGVWARLDAGENDN